MPSDHPGTPRPPGPPGAPRAPRVLITNDDGIEAPGIVALARAASRVFADVTVVAPATEQSAMSHALTVRRPVRVRELRPGWISLDGTPTDCVNIAVFQLLRQMPDLVLSGINRGYNLGEDVTYSGTVAGALEARLAGIPSLAISTFPEATPDDFDAAAEVALRLAREALTRGLPLDALLNVNVPPNPKGFRITRQGRRAAFEGLVEGPEPGREFFWVGLPPSAWLAEPGADHHAVADGFVSVTPLHADLTFHRAIPVLEGWGLDGLAPPERRPGNAGRPGERERP